MLGLFDRDYCVLLPEEIEEMNRLNTSNPRVVNAQFGRKNFFYLYPKAVRHYLSTFPNNYMDKQLLKDTDELNRQCHLFENLLDDTTISELDIKRFIQNDRYYHIPASIFRGYNFGHHEAALFKEFQLGTRYKADYLLAGRASGGWQFIFVEFEKPYGRVTIQDGKFGEVIRAGIDQINDWRSFIEADFQTISSEFLKYTNKTLSNEFYKYDSTRLHYVVVAGRRSDFTENTRTLQRRLELEQNIRLLHYDNLIDNAFEMIGRNTY